MRQFCFRRFDFSGACSINKRIRAGGQGSFFWLYKDILLLRAALALLLGYALVFGSGNTSEALRLLAHKSYWYWIVAGSFVFLVSVIYLNARTQAGRERRLLRFRALPVSAGTALWAAAYCWIASGAFSAIGWCFQWREAAVVSAAAVPLSVLAQFFFGSDRSLTDPLE
jgi:hypothetical protein